MVIWNVYAPAVRCKLSTYWIQQAFKASTKDFLARTTHIAVGFCTAPCCMLKL